MGQMWATWKSPPGPRGHLEGEGTLPPKCCMWVGPSRSRERGEGTGLIKDLMQLMENGLEKPSMKPREIIINMYVVIIIINMYVENVHFKPLPGRVQNLRGYQIQTQ